MTSAGRFTRAMHCAMRERLAGAGDAEQDLRAVAALEPLDELVDRAALIAAQLEIGDQFEAIVLGGHTVARRNGLVERRSKRASYHKAAGRPRLAAGTGHRTRRRVRRPAGAA